MFRENLKMSWNNIINNRMRSFLTALGIIIGVFSIIALISIVQAATDSVTSEFTDLGASKLIVTAPGTFFKEGLTNNDIENIKKIDGVSGVSPTLSFSATVIKGNTVEENVAIEGKNEIFFSTNPKLITRGRTLNVTDMNNKSQVCIINPELQQIIFPAEDPLGKQINVMGRKFTIVGVTDPDVTTDLVSTIQKNRGTNVSEGKVYLPYTVAGSMVGSNSIKSLEIIVETTDIMDIVKPEVENALNTAFNYKDDSFSIIDMDSILDTMNTMLNIMTIMLVGIASIALLVGGIGIMNMMLVSVTERTTEIGLRKALGAEPLQIQTQFLMESIFLSLFGGIIGLILGIATSIYVIDLLDVPFVLNWSAIALGVGFSAGVGIIFGWAPARRASRLNPIDALRSV